nr:5-oxoprolinase subunit PxpA [Bacillus sp. Marseille-P3661]
MRIDLNCDLGESFGTYTLGNDEMVLRYITSANIACGFHAGDPTVMRKTIQLANQANVAIGAHPGLPDLVGFGRRDMNIAADDVFNLVTYQIGALVALAKVESSEVQHVKPHGALYNMANKSAGIATAIVKAVKSVSSNLLLYALSGSLLAKIGKDHGLTVVQEVFADRTYLGDGTLTPRTEPNSVLHDTQLVTERIIRMIKDGKVQAITGEDITIAADTICVHGDNANALEFVETLNKVLMENQIIMKSPSDRI